MIPTYACVGEPFPHGINIRHASDSEPRQSMANLMSLIQLPKKELDGGFAVCLNANLEGRIRIPKWGFPKIGDPNIVP